MREREANAYWGPTLCWELEHSSILALALPLPQPLRWGKQGSESLHKSIKVTQQTKTKWQSKHRFKFDSETYDFCTYCAFYPHIKFQDLPKFLYQGGITHWHACYSRVHALESEQNWIFKSWFCFLGTLIITESFDSLDLQFPHL